MSIRRLVIVGGGIAAVSAASAARTHDPNCEIVICSDEAHLPYFRTKLSHYFHQDLSPQELQIHSEDWYATQRIDLRLETPVYRIDLAKQAVMTNNDTLEYDSLILAMGASSFVPPIPGADLPGVFRLRTLDDAKQIKSALRDDLRVVVVGGGILGLEAAWSLRQANARVSVVEMAARLMPKQTDIIGAKLLQQAVEQRGIDLYLGQAVKSIHQDGNALVVILDSETSIVTDLIVFSAGIRPHTELAKEAGVSINRGVLVDKRMQTSAPNVWACGDCAAVDGSVYGLWIAARQQGSIAGANAVGTGQKQAFADFTPKTMFSAFGINLFSIGHVVGETEAEKGYAAVDFPASSPTQSQSAGKVAYRRLFLQDRQVVGGLLINAPELVTEVSRLVESKASADALSSH